jgi:uncharacterized short protein YbdD (DUF466 family)
MPDRIHFTTHDSRLPTLFARLTRIMRGIAGMPDYAAYVEHQRRCHPDRAPLAERDFFAEYLRARYADGPNRCC